MKYFTKDSSPAPSPPLRSYSDTLNYLAGGRPAVMLEQPLGEGTYGTYVPVQPEFGGTADTLTIDPGQHSLPRDFVLAHEMGHKLYYANEPLHSAATPNGTTSPGLQAIIQRLHDRARYSNVNEGEPFAQTFAQALQSVRGHPYTAPIETGKTNPEDVSLMQDWIKAYLNRLNQQ